MLIYLMGTTRSGKTTYSKQVAARDGLYFLSFDGIWDYSRTAEEQWDAVAAKIQAALDQHKNIILDGMVFKALDQLHRDFPDACPTFMYTDFDIITKRVEGDKLYGWTHQSIRDSMTVYYKKLVDYHPSFVVGSNTGKFAPMCPDIFFRFLGNPWQTTMETWLLNRIDALNCDVKYSPIKVGDSIRPGYERATETLDKIRGLIKWTGKHVLEYGPHMAYAALNFYACQAKHVDLVERSADACKGVAEMAAYHGLHNITVITSDLENYTPSVTPDIVLCLNMFYGLKDKLSGATKLFHGRPEHAIVETNKEDFQYLDQVATREGYKKVTYPGRTNCSGHNRLIAHYTRHNK